MKVVVLERATNTIELETKPVVVELTAALATIPASLRSLILSSVKERRHEFAEPYDYSGVAASGSDEAAEVWSLTRLTVAEDGSTVTETATDSWDNRAAAVYA